MSPSVDIDRIGWWWWTDQQKCGGTVIAFYDYKGSVEYGTDYWASTSPWQLNYYCTVTNQGWVNGRHDFYEGGTTWYTKNGHRVSFLKVWNLRVNRLASSCLYFPSDSAIQSEIACLKSGNFS